MMPVQKKKTLHISFTIKYHVTSSTVSCVMDFGEKLGEDIYGVDIFLLG